MDQLMPRPANSSPITPTGFLERAATVYAESPSIIYGSTTYTWSDTHCRCLRLTSSISTTHGIRRGQVVSVIAPNIPAMYELHFAVPLSGAILNNINTRLHAHTISVILRHSESKLVFVDHDSVSLVLEAISLFPENTARPGLVLITDDGFQTNLSATADFIGTYEDMVDKGDPEFEWVCPVSEWEPIVLNYTSGTTSDPKGVVHYHRGTYLVTLNALLEWSVPKQPVFLWTLPMFHANGWSYTWGMAAVGGTNICLRKFDARVIYAAIRRHGVTHMCGAPVVLNMLSNMADTAPLSNSVHILTSGAPPPPAVLMRTEALGFVVSHGYGLTETCGHVVTCAWKQQWNKLPVSERARLKARQGVRTLGMSDVDVVDPDSGVSVTRDGLTMGEIVLRGGCIMLGYLKDPVGTSKCMRENGWFYTGDVGVMHRDGYLEIKDRSKDVIISGGENISSVEVESVLYTHPAINEVAVVGRPDEFWGETPCAFVSLKSELTHKLTEKDVIEFCRTRLPHYTVPKSVVFIDELPKTSTGKIQKFTLREMTKNMPITKSSKVSRM